MRDRMTVYYKRNKLTPLAYRDIAPSGQILKSGDLWSVDVVLQDHSLRPVAVEEKDGVFRVDWDSWVGYSEMPWEEFLEKKPTDPKLFRVLCTEVDYYNFSFGDDRKWRSFRLLSPDNEHVLYGYVPKYSVLGSLLTPSGAAVGGRPLAFLLRLRFPDRATGPNLVLIDEILCSGWVAPSE